jgi:hypothetical protein
MPTLLRGPSPADQSQPRDDVATFTGPRWPPRRRSTREKIPSPWRVLGSRNGVDRGHRRPGDSPPRNRLETPQLVSPAGIPLRHAGCLHSVSSHFLRALGCLIAHAHQVVSSRTFGTRLCSASLEKLLVGRVTVACRGSLYSASAGERTGPWSNLMLLLSVQDHGRAFSGASYRERGVSSGGDRTSGVSERRPRNLVRNRGGGQVKNQTPAPGAVKPSRDSRQTRPI